MKKLTLQICLSLGLLMTLAAVSAQAQVLTRYTAQIPFNFNIGNKTYQAGEYVIDTRKQMSVVELAIRNTENRNLKIMYILTDGERSSDEKTHILFSRVENQYFLTNMVAPEYGLRISKPKIRRELVKNSGRQNSQPQVVAIALTKADKMVE